MQKISLFFLKVDNNVHVIIYTKDTSNVPLVYGLYPFVYMHIYILHYKYNTTKCLSYYFKNTA